MNPPPPPVPIVPPKAPAAPLGSMLTRSNISTFETSENRVPLAEGTVVGAYVIDSTLGQGGFGITYRATHRERGTKLVIKEHMPRALAMRESDGCTVTYTTPENEALFDATLAEFNEEVSVLMGLQHPGIVPILDAFEANGTAYYVMPFVNGQALEISAQATLSPERRAEEARRLKRLLLQMLDTLTYLGQHNVVHRDLKPENIRITPEGRPVLLDFGSARQIQAGKVYTNIYTPGFCAPEQAAAQTDSELTDRLGPWTDVYSLGATFHYLITRLMPPRAEMRLHAHPDPYNPLSHRDNLRETYGKSFLQALDRAMALRLSDRWQSAADWRAAIEEGLVPATPGQLRRARLLVAGSGLALAVLGGVSLWALHERDQARNLYRHSLHFTEGILYDFNDQLADLPGSTTLQQQLGDSLNKFLTEVEGLPIEDEDTNLQQDIATAWFNLGCVYAEQGKMEDADRALRRAEQLLRNIFDDGTDDSTVQEELARVLLRRAALVMRDNRLEEAESLTATSLDLLRDLCKDFPNSPRFRCRLGTALGQKARLASLKSASEERRQALEEMLELYRSLTAAFPEHKDARKGLAECLHLYGTYELEKENFEKVASLFREEETVYEQLLSEQPYNLSYKKGLAISLFDDGQLHNTLSLKKDPVRGDAEEDKKALAAFGCYLALAGELERLDRTNTVYATMSCTALAYRIDALLRTDQPEQALAQCNTLMTKINKLLEISPDDVILNMLKAGAWRGLARLHSAADGDLTKAADEISEYRQLTASLRERVKGKKNIDLEFSYLDALTESATIALRNGDVFSALNFVSEAEAQLAQLLKAHPNDEVLTKQLALYRQKLEALPTAAE